MSPLARGKVQHPVQRVPGAAQHDMPGRGRSNVNAWWVHRQPELRDGGELEPSWIEIQQKGAVVGRGLGILEMIRAIAEDRPHLASGELGRHVLDVMLSAEESVECGEFVTVTSSVPPVPALPEDFEPFVQTL